MKLFQSFIQMQKHTFYQKMCTKITKCIFVRVISLLSKIANIVFKYILLAALAKQAQLWTGNVMGSFFGYLSVQKKCKLKKICIISNCKHFLCGVSSSILCMRKENTCWIGSCGTSFCWSDNFEQKCKESYTNKFIFYPQNDKIATLIRLIDIR